MYVMMLSKKKNNIDKSDKSYTKYNPSFVKKKNKNKTIKTQLSPK